MNLEAARKSRGLSQAALARAIGLKSRSVICDIEAERRDATLLQALKIRRELGVKIGPLANVPDKDIPALERMIEAA